MSIGGEYEFRKITDQGLLAEAVTLGLNSDWAQLVVSDTKTNILDCFIEARNDILGSTNRAVISEVTSSLVNALEESQGK